MVADTVDIAAVGMTVATGPCEIRRRFCRLRFWARMIRPPTRRATRLPAKPAWAALALLVLSGPALGQAAPQPRGPAAIDAVKQRDQELDAIRAEQKKAAESARKLENEIDALGEDRRK